MVDALVSVASEAKMAARRTAQAGCGGHGSGAIYSGFSVTDAAGRTSYTCRLHVTDVAVRTCLTTNGGQSHICIYDGHHERNEQLEQRADVLGRVRTMPQGGQIERQVVIPNHELC